MAKQESVVANKPTTNKAGDKFGSFLATPAKAGTFNSVSASTNSCGKGKGNSGTSR